MQDTFSFEGMDFPGNLKRSGSLGGSESCFLESILRKFINLPQTHFSTGFKSGKIWIINYVKTGASVVMGIRMVMLSRND